jgi:hypothetical protein
MNEKERRILEAVKARAGEDSKAIIGLLLTICAKLLDSTSAAFLRIPVEPSKGPRKKPLADPLSD